MDIYSHDIAHTSRKKLKNQRSVI